MDNYSLRGQVFHAIREDILKGRYKENDELRETTLGKELGVSRTPVREALRQLELEGLVKIIPNRGAFVTGISEKDVRDIYMVRSVLEGLCVQMAAEHMTKERIDELEEVLLLAEYYLEKGNMEQLTELDGKFHQILYTASESRILEHVLSDFHKYVQLARRNSVKTESRAQKSLEEHREILEALKENDAEKAEKLANTHILNVMKNLHLNQEQE
ncbi:MAG: GntR family transcriptional regulator [bacterium]|nr:GntR family transcriptional regulator [bacterium]